MKRKENGKLIFCKKKLETPFGNRNMHICAKYGHFMINYAMIMAMTTVIWLESHECSYMISLFVKKILKIFQNSSLLFFLTNSTYKRTPCKKFAFFDIFFIFFVFFQ